MSSLLIIYSTTDGQTEKICARLRQVVEEQSHKGTVVSIRDIAGVDLTTYDKIIIGASIRYGKHSPLISGFIERNRGILESRPSAFFSVNVVARKPEKCRPENNPYLQKFLKRISWKPGVLAVFAGKLDYPSYSFFDRQMIRLIMLMTKGPTDPKTIIEYTDWHKVDEFGHIIANM